jgi:hypothetical protein
MSLRIPPPEADPLADPAGDSGNAPLANPFAAGPGGFLTNSDLDLKGGKHNGVAILVIVIGLAAGLLMGMRHLGMGPKVSLANIDIDYAFDSDAPAPSKDHSRVLHDLQTGGKFRRVPLEMVQTNPFAWRSLVPPDTAATGPDPADLTRKQAEARRKAIADAAKMLVLNSVMAGRIPVARISGELVKVGDTVGEYFTVQAIGGRSVDLEADGQVHTLTLGEPDDSKPKPKR